MTTIPVVAAVIVRRGEYLICQRPSHKRHGGLWEFPGGKVHDGESLADAIRRELAEELHIESVWIGDVLHAIPDADSMFLVQFVDVAIAGEPRSTEHPALAWVAKADLLRYELAPSDRLFALSLSEHEG